MSSTRRARRKSKCLGVFMLLLKIAELSCFFPPGICQDTELSQSEKYRKLAPNGVFPHTLSFSRKTILRGRHWSLENIVHMVHE